MQENSQVDPGSVSILIPSIKAGDELAREELMAILMSHLNESANRNLGKSLRQKAGVSDIVQQSFVQIIEKFAQFRGNTRAELLAWIESIVVNEIRNTNRAFKTRKRDVSREQSLQQSQNPTANSPADPQLTPSSEAITQEKKQRIHQLLNELAPDYAEVIRLRNLESLPFKEIADRMNRSEEAVSQLWYRAMLKFEQKLKGEKDLSE